MTPIPVIDLSAVERSQTAVVEQIASACSEWGFFQVVNHGVSEGLIERVWDETHRFFELPRQAKLKILRSKENPRGYYDRELTKNTRDLKEVFDFGGVPHPELPDSHPDNRDMINGHNLWPTELPNFRSAMLEYFDACEILAMQLLELFCLGLDSPADAMHASFTPDHTSFIRLNYYPLQDPLETEVARKVTKLGDMALHHHSDAGALTILLQDEVGGLQVFAKDKWWDVEPELDAFVINTADMMQVWSNDRYRAPLHRVVPITDRPRYSIPFFFNPSYESDCAPLESLLDDEGPHYRPVNWGTFRQLRTDGDYADYGKEVQLTEYRI
ncbi:MAG: 2-oxoglutarate and iron-dependent oxygenase domain-containing protein [Arenicellales bacterium]|nr:2-oxoglutarate and iron-dependent oxygenase domain-containing protein [Arenicellales bacterium]